MYCSYKLKLEFSAEPGVARFFNEHRVFHCLSSYEAFPTLVVASGTLHREPGAVLNTHFVGVAEPCLDLAYPRYHIFPLFVTP